MAGSNAGTGHPLTLRCTRCKRYRDYKDPAQRDKGCHLEATGRTRPRERLGGARTTNRKIEYRCLDCGHVGWTIHVWAERLFERKCAELGVPYVRLPRSWERA